MLPLYLEWIVWLLVLPLCIKWHMMGWRGNLICFANLTQTSKSRKLSVSNHASRLLKCQTSTSSTFRGYISKEYGFQFSQRRFQCHPVLKKTAVSFLKTEWFLHVFFVCLFVSSWIKLAVSALRVVDSALSLGVTKQAAYCRGVSLLRIKHSSD